MFLLILMMQLNQTHEYLINPASTVLLPLGPLGIKQTESDMGLGDMGTREFAIRVI